MGQKVNAIGFRLGINQESESTWYATGKEYARCIAMMRRPLVKPARSPSVYQISLPSGTLS